MKYLINVVSVILCLILQSQSMCAQTKTKGATDKIIVYHGMSATETISALQKKKTKARLSHDDIYYLALAYFVNRDFQLACDTAEAGLKTKDAKEKASLYALTSQALAAQGKFEKAADAASTGQKLNPNSKILAAFRIALYGKIGDKEQEKAAKEHLMRLDPNFNSQPVMSVQDGCQLVGKIAVVVIAVVEAVKTVWPHIEELLVSLKTCRAE